MTKLLKTFCDKYAKDKVEFRPFWTYLFEFVVLAFVSAEANAMIKW